VAVTYTAGSQKLILDYSPELKGLERDMPVQQALARYGHVELVHADMAYYWSAFNEILDALELKSPLVEGSILGDIYIGLDGLGLLYPEDDILVEAMRSVIPESFDARLGIAKGKLPAYLAAVNSPRGGYNALACDITSFLKDLSCDLLSVSPKIKERLHDFGLHTLGKVAVLPSARLEAQFGPEGRRIWQLANGHDDTPFCPRLSEEIIEESTSMPSATVSLDMLLMALESMLIRAFARLGNRGKGIRRITLWTRTWLLEYWERRISFKEPVMNVRAVLSRVKQVMENSPQPGPVEQIGMKVTGLGWSLGRQSSIFTEVRSKDHLLGEIRQLEFRLGAPQLFKVKETEPWSRIPERRYILTPLNC
jgi:DNA polymerase-4/protein ImuB